MKIGILFGGPSREREISFAGGRTVYDNLDKSLFEAVPLFVDSHKNIILLDWQYVYKGTIRDFYPPIDFLPPSPNNFQVYLESLGNLPEAELEQLIKTIGKRVQLHELPDLIDFAFLALHGEFGEDGQIQGLMESLQIPYSGSGIKACSIGMDKAFQKKLMSVSDFPCPKVHVIDRAEWLNPTIDKQDLFQILTAEIGYPLVIRPANQGSSIGVAIKNEADGFQGFQKAVEYAFFLENITAEGWKSKSEEDKIQFLKSVCDIREGIGFPLDIDGNTYYHPEKLLEVLNTHFNSSSTTLKLEGHLSEQQVIIEEFIDGQEFSCIVLKKEDNTVVALPPTEILKGKEVFDYRSKYLAGLSRKETPIRLPIEKINAIRSECERLFNYLEFNTYARIDGFIKENGVIYLNDPNTTSGMLPSSFFFHQAAEIGLNPSQFLTYIIRASLQERRSTALSKNHYPALLEKLDQKIASLKTKSTNKRRIAVILGGYSTERHISVESGRNIFEKLASSDKYEPIPVFLTGTSTNYEFYQIPINLLLKDNADDIRDKILHYKTHQVIEDIKVQCTDLTEKYASKDVIFAPKKLDYTDLMEMADGVFLALHGRPGEDGTLQKELDKLGIPYNGSPPDSSHITINKYDTLQLLKQHGFTVTNQELIHKEDFANAAGSKLNEIEEKFGYPLIAKPVDDGCSSAVKLIKSRAQMQAFLSAIFRKEEFVSPQETAILALLPKEEFPMKNVVLIEELIQAKGAKKFLEITGGLLTHHSDSAISYEIFEPSEALASSEILSLEEKFLAGEGQNITPARFADNKKDYTYIAAQVKKDLEKAAKILNVRGYARIDAFVRIFEDNKAETIIIEVNSLPGMTPATCIFHQSAINHYKPYGFIDKILEFGFHEKSLQ